MGLKIQYMSDFHLEFRDNLDYVKSNDFEVTGDVLVLAGDTMYLKDNVMPRMKFWNWASKNFRHVMLIPGNHEFYGNGDVAEHGDSWQIMFRKNIGYYYNKVLRIDDVDFILTTLWSRIPEQDEYFVWRGMNDFRQIMYKGRRFTTEDFNLEHEKCLAFLKKAVKESTAKHVVVVTHHLPTQAVVADQHKGSLLNGAFATELGDFIADNRIDAWIYGHSHTNINKVIGETLIVSNQLGYVFNDEHVLNGFDPSAHIELT
jgi:predicted phosphodiesterase